MVNGRRSVTIGRADIAFLSGKLLRAPRKCPEVPPMRPEYGVTYAPESTKQLRRWIWRPLKWIGPSRAATYSQVLRTARHVKLELSVMASHNDANRLNHSHRMATLSEVRDAFQQRLLTCLYRGPASSSLVLKGGAAMRVLTASARYTQDLDFDHDPRRPLTSLQTTVRSAIARALQGSDLTQTSISEPKQTDTVARWPHQHR